MREMGQTPESLLNTPVSTIDLLIVIGVGIIVLLVFTPFRFWLFDKLRISIWNTNRDV